MFLCDSSSETVHVSYGERDVLYHGLLLLCGNLSYVLAYRYCQRVRLVDKEFRFTRVTSQCCLLVNISLRIFLLGYLELVRSFTLKIFLSTYI